MFRRRSGQFLNVLCSSIYVLCLRGLPTFSNIAIKISLLKESVVILESQEGYSDTLLLWGKGISCFKFGGGRERAGPPITEIPFVNLPNSCLPNQ